MPKMVPRIIPETKNSDAKKRTLHDMLTLNRVDFETAMKIMEAQILTGKERKI